MLAEQRQEGPVQVVKFEKSGKVVVDFHFMTRFAESIGLWGAGVK
jgi:hypothetical protein